MKKMLFVMNPFAGMRKANRFLADMVTVFNRADHEVTVYMTAGPGDAARMVEEKAAEMDLVVCCGGDGTFNEPVSGLLKSGRDVSLGYIPAGSTNDFANSLGLKGSCTELARRIAEGEDTHYDVGLFGSRYFTYVASFGAFTKASYSAPQNVKNAIGHLAYILEGIQELSQIRATHLKLEINGQTYEDDYIFGAISNSTSLGGVLTLDPKQVDMADGKFEIMLIRAPRDLAELSECLTALQKKQYNCAMMTFCSAERVLINAPEDMPWTLDGEKEEGHARIEAVNLHHAIRLRK